METMDEKPIVHDVKSGGAEGVTTEKLAPNEAQIQKRTPGEKIKNTGKKVLGDIKQAGKNAVEKTKDWYSGVKDKYNNAESTYEDPYTQRPEVNYRIPTVASDEEERDNQNIMKERIAETEDLIQRGAETGAEASAALQNVKVPKSKLSSYQDIMNSEEYKGQRIPYMANAIGTNLANLLSGKDYKSYLKSHNEQMADTYAKNKAAVDTAATNANIQDIEAGNKAEMGKYVQMSDAMTEAALKRYGLLEDTENKRQMLESIINDATGLDGYKWGDLDADQKIAVMSLLQAYNGDYSMMSLAMEKYGDKIFDFLDKLSEKLGGVLGINNGNGENGEPTENADTGEPGPTSNDVIVLPDGKEITREKYEKNKKDYVEIPTVNGGEPVIVRRYGAGWTGRTREDTKKAIEAITSNPQLSDEEMLDYANQVDGITDNPMTGSMGAEVTVAVEKFIKNRNNYNDLMNKIIANYNNYDVLKTLGKEVEKTGDPTLQEYYKEKLGIASVKKDIADWKQDSSLTTKDKIELLDKLGNGEYATYIANDPSLQEYIEQERQGYQIRQTYNDPLLDQTNTYLTRTTGDGKGNAWRIQSNGNIAYVQSKKGKESKIKEYDLGSSNAVENIDTATWSKIIDNLLLNSPNNVLSIYNTKSNRTLSPKEAKEYFKQSSEYAAITKLLGNQLLSDKALAMKENGEPENAELYKRYDLLEKLYNKWD
jgi:hypothetical protein